MSAIVKYMAGALKKKPSTPKAVTVLEPKPATPIPVPDRSHLTNAMAPSLGITKVFDAAPEMRGLFENYFGFDPANFAMMSPEMIGEFTDMVNQAKLFDEMLPVIKGNVDAYIKAKVNYDKFIADCIKQGAAGMKSIDESTLQVFLEMKGYQVNREKLGRKSDNSVKLLEEDRKTSFELSDYNLQAALISRASQLVRQKQQIDTRPTLQAEQSQEREAHNARIKSIKDTITYGKRGRN